MIKRLTRHGNSRALVIDRSVLDLLQIDDDTPLEITTDGESLLISPVREGLSAEASAKAGERAERFQAALDKSNRKYGRALKRLAG